MVALYRSGRQVDALERYQRARRKLIDEFGIEPGPRLQEIQSAVLTHDATLDLPGRFSSRRRRKADVRRPASAPRWLMAGTGAAALLVLAVVLALTVGHSGGRAHKRGVLADWAGISSPSSGEVYARGQFVATSFSCGQVSGGPALMSCSDSAGTATSRVSKKCSCTSRRPPAVSQRASVRALRCTRAAIRARPSGPW